jgi:hypothetical protein
MISKKILALAALSLVAGSSAASAQTAQPLSLANSPVAARAGADLQGENHFLRRSGWLLGIVAVAVLIFVVLEASKDNELPTSA